MIKNRLMIFLGLLLIASMVLASCKPAETETTPAAETAAVTSQPATEETAASTTTRKGGWLDEIDFSVVSVDSAVTQIKAGASDIYADGVAAADVPQITDANLPYFQYNGLQYSILYNPTPCTDASILNPFADEKIREATNWLYDRNYINQEIYAGANLLKWFPITTQFPMYSNLADVAAKLEAEYAFNPEKAAQAVDEEMTKLGAAKNADGKWAYKGKVITLNFLIRNDSDGTRIPIGDYVASQLESIGFTVNRQYKTSTEAGPIWQVDNPANCAWSLYTAAWSATVIDREEKTLFQQYYTPESTQGIEPLNSATPDEEFDVLANKIANGDYSTLAERDQMIAQTMELSLKDSLQVWLIDGKAFVPYNDKVQLTYDLAAGIQGAQIYPFTLRFKDQEGGIMRIGQQDLFGQPFNPVGGSNWAYDQMPIRATTSGATMNDPFTGLVWPFNLESATVTVKEGSPVTKTLDWVDLETAPEIKVPTDAYVDWNAKTQTFITAGEKFPEGTTAKVRSVAVYPKDLFEKITWHDGSHLDVADFMMGMILAFERGNPDSPLYDESYVPYYDSFMQSFKGFRFTSTDPLTIEFYSDVLAADAELDVYSLWPGPTLSWYSSYVFGEGSWDVLTLANLAEGDKKMAYSTGKSSDEEVDWTNLIGGPGLEILDGYLDQVIADKYVPYEPTLGKYITPDDAVERYTNLKNWYKEHGHFWIGTGPYYIDRAYMTEKTLTLKHYDAYQDPADRWSNFGAPKIAEVALDGPAQVKIGDQAEFMVNITANSVAYPADEIKSVKYLLFDANNNVLSTGDAELVADGQYKVVLTGDITSKLTTGSDKLTVSVVPIPVAIPTFSSVNFVTLAK